VVQALVLLASLAFTLLPCSPVARVFSFLGGSSFAVGCSPCGEVLALEWLDMLLLSHGAAFGLSAVAFPSLTALGRHAASLPEIFLFDALLSLLLPRQIEHLDQYVSGRYVY
jgi:hypothetical protein